MNTFAPPWLFAMASDPLVLLEVPDESEGHKKVRLEKRRTATDPEESSAPARTLDDADMSDTDATFQAPTSWLKAEAPESMLPALATAATFQLPMFWLNAAAP